MTVQWFAQFQYLAGSCTLTLQSPLLDPPGILSGVCGCSYKSNGLSIVLNYIFGSLRLASGSLHSQIIPAYGGRALIVGGALRSKFLLIKNSNYVGKEGCSHNWRSSGNRPCYHKTTAQ